MIKHPGRDNIRRKGFILPYSSKVLWSTLVVKTWMASVRDGMVAGKRLADHTASTDLIHKIIALRNGLGRE